MVRLFYKHLETNRLSSRKRKGAFIHEILEYCSEKNIVQINHDVIKQYLYQIIENKKFTYWNKCIYLIIIYSYSKILLCELDSKEKYEFFDQALTRINQGCESYKEAHFNTFSELLKNEKALPHVITYQIPSFCRYCDSSRIKIKKAYSGSIFLCLNCGAEVDIHENTFIPKGTLSNKWLKQKKTEIEKELSNCFQGNQMKIYQFLRKVFNRIYFVDWFTEDDILLVTQEIENIKKKLYHH